MKSIKTHLIFGISYFLVCYFSDLVLDPDASLLKEIIFFTTQNVFLFYALYYFLKKFSNKNRLALIISITRLLIIVLCFFILRYTVRYYFLATFFDARYGQKPIHGWAIETVLWIITYFIMSLAYFYFVRSIEKEHSLNNATRAKLVAEQEQLKLENALLKAQINPHFLYNTLNFLYAKAIPLSSQLSDGILKLSEIMRYSVQSQDEKGLVYLYNEIEHVQNIIELNQLRFSNKLQLKCSFDNVPGDVKIIPLVLLTLVENVLKHGVLNDAEQPAVIALEFNKAKQFSFVTRNKKRTGPKEISTGIGLENTIKRLQHEYGNRHSLHINNETDHYRIALHIDFSPHTLSS